MLSRNSFLQYDPFRRLQLLWAGQIYYFFLFKITNIFTGGLLLNSMERYIHISFYKYFIRKKLSKNCLVLMILINVEVVRVIFSSSIPELCLIIAINARHKNEIHCSTSNSIKLENQQYSSKFIYEWSEMWINVQFPIFCCCMYCIYFVKRYIPTDDFYTAWNTKAVTKGGEGKKKWATATDAKFLGVLEFWMTK